MAPYDAKDRATVDAARIVWQTTRHYLDESASANHRHVTACATGLQTGLLAALSLQNAMIQTSLILFDAGIEAGFSWFNWTTEAARLGRDATAGMLAASFEMVQATLPAERG